MFSVRPLTTALTPLACSPTLGTPGRPAPAVPQPRGSTEESLMILIGLTGNIGSGKSTVAQLLSERGATIVDADVLARRAVELGTPGYDKIVARWGTDVLAPDKHIDRAALRRIVFTAHEQLQ